MMLGERKEILNVISMFDLNFNLGSAVRNILKKEEAGVSKTGSLKEAIFYLQHEIEVRNKYSEELPKVLKDHIIVDVETSQGKEPGDA